MTTTISTPPQPDSATQSASAPSTCWAPFREYCAMQFYRMEHARNGTAGVRWWCLREDLREKYLAMADQVVKAWEADENAAKQRSEDAGAEMRKLASLPNAIISDAPNP